MPKFFVLGGFALCALLGASSASAQLIISEFRYRGPNGANDEFIELYNNSGADHTVTAAVTDGTNDGYAVVASDGTTRCIVPNGTVIPNTGHYLCVNSVGYSLASYPAGNGTTATGDATYTTNIPENVGIAVFNNSVGGVNFALANRMDAVGTTAEADTLYKEGTGLPTLVGFSIDYAWVRDNCGKGGSITTFGPCPVSGAKDTNNNAADFYFVDTNGTSAGGGQRLGAPGPENLSSPLVIGDSVSVAPLDSCVADTSPPNRVRDFTSDPANNSTFGTLDIRQTVTNNTGGNMTRLRWRIVDLTTFPAPSGIADLRPRTSTAVVVTVDRPPCGVGTSNVTVEGTALEQPPSQPNGGGFNSSLSSGTVNLGTPLANGATLDLRFLFGIQQNGCFKVGFQAETLPGGGFSAPVVIQGGTNGSCGPAVSSIVRADPDPTSAATVDFTVTFTENVTGVDAADFVVTMAGGVAGATVTNVSGANNIYTVTVDTGTGNGTIRLDVNDNDTIQNLSAVPLGGVGPDNGDFTTGEAYTIDKSPPTVTIDQALGQTDPTSLSPINFTVVFSEATADFATGDVTLAGTAGATTAVVTGGPTTYNVAVSGMTTSGTVIATVNAGVATDSLGNPNAASTSGDNTVTFNADVTAPTVTINQAVAQLDPTNASPINYTVVFSEPVVGFATGDVTLGGTAGATTATVTGGGANYNVAVSGMVGPGTVIASIGAGVATDAALNPNAASTSADNTVTFDNVAPTASIAQAVGQTDPSNSAPIRFTITFSEPVTGFDAGDVVIGGTAGATTAVVTGGPTAYTIEVSGMTTNGTVTVTVGAGAANDAAGNASGAAAIVDNSVQFIGSLLSPTVPLVVPAGDRATWLLLAAITLLVAGLALTRRNH